LIELRGQPANPSSPGKMTIKMECMCVCVWLDYRHGDVCAAGQCHRQ